MPTGLCCYYYDDDDEKIFFSWNFTLSQVSVSLIEGEEEEDENEGEGKRHCLFDDNHSVTAHANTFEGILIIMDRMRGISLDFKV